MERIRIVSVLTDIINAHFAESGEVWPRTAWEALGWAHTEMGEVYEQLLNIVPVGWMRNNPHDDEVYTLERLEEELGDVIMMVQVAGMMEGLDPMKALVRKISEDNS